MNEPKLSLRDQAIRTANALGQMVRKGLPEGCQTVMWEHAADLRASAEAENVNALPYECEGCYARYAEYVNGCPRCSARGLSFSVVHNPAPPAPYGAALAEIERLKASHAELLRTAKARLADCREDGGCSDAALMPDEVCSTECADLTRAIANAEALKQLHDPTLAMSKEDVRRRG